MARFLLGVDVGGTFTDFVSYDKTTREVKAWKNLTTPADPTAFSTLVFTVEDAVAKPNPYVLRLRVDGVDSIPVDFSGDTPAFRDNQKVTIL